MKTDFYLHNDNNLSEIKSNLREDVDDAIVNTLAEQLYDFFYEVGFDVEYNEDGKIISVKMKKKV